MFTGIIKDVGHVVSFSKTSRDIFKLIVKSKLKPFVDDSVSVNGVCQTVVKVNDYLHFDVVKSTIHKTNFKNLKRNSLVNLELALKLSDRLDGHLVTGHVNCCGKIENITQYGDSFCLKVSFNSEYRKYVCKEGSITIEGISLTISELQENLFEVFIVPHTWNNTNLKNFKIGDLVNLEFDILAKYIENMIAHPLELKKRQSAIHEILK